MANFTPMRKAVLSYAALLIGSARSKNSKRYREYKHDYHNYMMEHGITVTRDGRNWYVNVNGKLFDTAPRRWLVTKTNPKGRELNPIFKGRW